MISFSFTQETPSDTWVINHNLGFLPACDVFTNNVGGLQKIMPASVTHVSNNQLVITFDFPVTGIAMVV